ncbi:hypothetical protein AKJ55_01045 [candidate division MSBL1 archaeon SCGC-AAA382M17]|uniref:Endonuclease/exonuclease/phosphatase domain-containing protein n=1 Tax=candidate division MSBL1 archaeon SCGC-AAA382M17 TaxID=1698284 RepID=A0ABR5TJK2_9EURY|nr:hypothetical protein AKJ55_01045 [candidate division MSBL1 archaeon SCGC-AAA382M17]
MYYGKNTDFCDVSNNSVAERQSHLKKILNYVRPDIFTVNELDGNASEPIKNDATHLLDNTLNVNGITYYRKAPFQKTYLANTLFYNANKLRLYSYKPIPFYVGNHEKIFNAYTFYYNGRHLSQSLDTTFLTCFVIHLKSGNDDTDALQRANEAEILMDYIDNEMPNSGNYIICGDLNVYSSGERAFQILTKSCTTKSGFYDPVDQSGNWHNNEKYKLYHTQSTHLGDGCFSSGGMDDRFDFILLSNAIMGGVKGIRYIQDSYEILGQDGQGFNSLLRVKNNEAVPVRIAKALYNFSDHLPVKLSLRIDEDPAVELSFDSVYHRPMNPLLGDSIWVFAQLTDTERQVSSLKLIWGKESQHHPNQAEMKLSGNFYSSGLKSPGETFRIYYKVIACDSSGTVVYTSGEKEVVFEENTTAQINSVKNKDFKISNPVKNQLNLYFTGNLQDDLFIVIVGITGEVKFRKLYSGLYRRRLTIPVSFLPPGVYWIKVRCKNFVGINMFIKH